MVRGLAVDALTKVHRTSCLAHEALVPIVGKARLSPEDQAFLWELVHGVTRHRVTIDHIIRAFSRVRLGKVHPRVLQALRIAVYQIVWLDRIPARAAVYETVEIVKSRFPGWTVKFTNGCLRSISRAIDIKIGGTLDDDQLSRAVPISGFRFCLFERPIFPEPDADLVGSLAARHGYPGWLVARWLDRFGRERAVDILRAGNESPSLWLRPAPGRFPDLVRELTKRRIRHAAEDEPAPPAIRLIGSPGRIQDLPGFSHGWFVVQDRSAMKPAALLAPPPGARVLDLCAAPGGKATQLALDVGPEGSVVAVDRDPRRLERLTESIGRLGITNVAAVAADLTEEGIDLGEPFDHVLIDVPCSNTGVLGKRVEARHRVTAEFVTGLVPVQRALLEAATRHVAPGGALVYSTCALLAEENGTLVRSAIEAGLPFEIEEEAETLPRAGTFDGGYAVRLRRVGEG
ncbi:MAG: transcription antitermination factor NusB [Planctomycetota bacterium]